MFIIFISADHGHSSSLPKIVLTMDVPVKECMGISNPTYSTEISNKESKLIHEPANVTMWYVCNVQYLLDINATTATVALCSNPKIKYKQIVTWSDKKRLAV